MFLIKENMTSGIYRLTFSSGKYYVGKSLDIDTRWKQHFNKFALGKAARPMQLEFDRCGPPKTEVLFECHKDHIDILEEWLIDQLKGPDMLNTTYPDIVRTEAIADIINTNTGELQLSTWEHLELIQNYKVIADEAIKLSKRWEDKVQEYKKDGYIIDADYEDAVDVAARYHTEAIEYKDELTRLKNLNWWERLFNYSVNV